MLSIPIPNSAGFSVLKTDFIFLAITSKTLVRASEKKEREEGAPAWRAQRFLSFYIGSIFFKLLLFVFPALLTGVKNILLRRTILDKKKVGICVHDVFYIYPLFERLKHN